MYESKEGCQFVHREHPEIERGSVRSDVSVTIIMLTVTNDVEIVSICLYNQV